MSLENVKVGDRVWVESKSFSGNRSRRLALITKVTPAYVFSAGEQWRRVAGKKRGQRAGTAFGFMSSGYVTGIATADEIAEVEAARAKDKADCEAETIAQQQAYQEKCERVFRVWQLLETQREFGLYQQMRDQDFCEISHDGHKFRIEEVEETE